MRPAYGTIHPMTADYSTCVRAWAAELRDGSTRTWAQFLEEPSHGDLALDPLPSAAQLEVVRRLPRDAAHFAGLADLVLATPAAWRGRIDVPLPWHEPPAFGSPPVAPETLPADELLRVVASAITTLLVAEPECERPRPPRARPFRKRFVLLGAPSSRRTIAGQLVACGLREGGPKATYVVLGGPLEMLMAQRWAARIQAGSTIRWRRFWRYVKTHDRIPPGIQGAALAEGLARQVGGARVHLVLASSTQAAMDTVAEIFGLAPVRVEEPAELLSTDLLRVVNAPLTLAAGEAGRARIVEQLWPELAGGEQPATIGAPRPHLDWAVDAAEHELERIVKGARTAGYAVHGNPRIVVPDPAAKVPRSIRRHDTLELGLTVLGRAWGRSVARGGA